MQKQKAYLDRLEEKYSSPYIQIPNNLITRLKECMENEKGRDSAVFGFSYLILNGFLYKYTHYVDVDNNDLFTHNDILVSLKKSPNSNSSSWITKSDGFLVENEFMEKTTDIPVKIFWSANQENPDMEIREILRLSDMPDYIQSIYRYDLINSPRFSANIPDFMIDYGTKKGTLNDYRNTFQLTYKEFSYFMFSEETTLKDFAMYCLIKAKSGKERSSETSISYEQIDLLTGVSHTVARKSMDNLSKLDIITVTKPKQNKQSLYNRRANIYKINRKFSEKTKRKFSKEADKKFNKVRTKNRKKR